MSTRVLRKTLTLALAAITILGTQAALSTASGGPLKIMPLGDSITQGNTLAGSIPGGYREELHNRLTAAGVDAKFVGSWAANPSPALTAAGNVNHEGHGGYTIQQIIHGIQNSNWLSVDPDVILLHIGANDILKPDAATAPDRLDALLGLLVAQKRDARIIVAKIIGGSTITNDSRAAAYDSGIVVYDAAIAQKVAARAEAGQHVSLVDMYRLMNINHQTTDAGQLLFSDLSHPSKLGYDLMGRAWAAAVMASVPEPDMASLITTAAICGLGICIGRCLRYRPVPQCYGWEREREGK